jgi:hypothetical protein
MTFDYNTSRSKLVLPEYGRNIQKMVEYIKTVEDRDERNRLAKALIVIMGNMNPHLRDINDFKHKLWDHLAIISNFELDIDYPYEIPQAETFTEKPKIVPYGTHRITYKHYGKSIEFLIEAASELPENEEKEKLVLVIANHMKKSYLTWNRDVVSDEVIIKNIAEISKGKITLPPDTVLAETKDLLSKNKRRRTLRKK